MVISYIYSTCWCMKSTFYEHQHGPCVHDSGRATQGFGILALPVALLVSPSGYVGATGTASTSAVATSKSCTSSSFGKPSSDDHASEAGLSATSRHTHPVDHFGVDLVTGALHPRYPHRSELVPCHERIICCLDDQQYLGSCPSPRWLQRRHRQVHF
jgi:hypothetical protein